MYHLILSVFILSLQVKAELFPQGQQWNYSYYALLRSGTLLPTEVHSQWDLRAVLTITATKDIVLAQLNNFSTSVYNGLRDAVSQDSKPTPAPNEATALSIPFLINYVGTQVESISVDEADLLWSVNIKRAIASILQLQLDKLHTSASYMSENNIYGHCKDIEYNIVNNTEYIYVRKVIDNLNCLEFPLREWSTGTKFSCSGVLDDPYASSTTREYTLTERDKYLELKHMLSNKRLYVQPFQAQSDANQIYQYQVYELLNSAPAPTDIKIPENLLKKQLTYEHTDSDFSHGRSKKMKQERMLDEINKRLDKIVENLNEQDPEINITKLHEKEIPMLYYHLFRLDFESLKKLHADIAIGTSYAQETKRNIFLELLPQIGTVDSINFMKDLIVNRELKSLISIKMLSIYPFYVRQYNSTLLNDMEVLLNLGDNYDAKIRDTAILSFATLVYKTFSAGECSLETFEHHALKYFNSFSESTSYEKRLIYLEGLENLQLGSVINYVTSVIKNSEQSRHIRYLAVWASILSVQKRPQQSYELYWPIMTDRTQHLEMRVAAFTMLLLAQPTRSRLLTLFWYMQAEPDPHLYNMFYTTIISLQKTTYPCYNHLGKLANYIIRFLHAPRNKQYWMTGYYIIDYIDSNQAFGGIAEIFLVGNPITNSPNIIYISLNNYASKRNLNQVGLYLKLQGIPDYIKDTLSTATVDIQNIDKMLKLLEKSNVKLLTPEEIHIELIIEVQGKAVFCYYIDEKNFKKLTIVLRDIKMLLQYHLNYQSVVLSYIYEHMEPSDAGTLIVRAVESNSIASIRGNFTSDTTTKMNINNFDIDFRYFTQTVSFLEVYNPISDMWHGTAMIKATQGHFLFNGTLHLNTTAIKLTEERNGNEYIGATSHSRTLTYIESNNFEEQVQPFPKYTSEFAVNDGGRKVNKILIDIPFEDIGTKFTISVFDCDKYRDIRKILLNVYSSHQSNYQIIPFTQPFLYGIHIIDYLSYIPTQGSCGLSMNLKPFHKEPTELAIISNVEKYTTLSSVTDPERGTEFIANLTLFHRKLPDGPDLQSWNATFKLLSRPGSRNINMSLAVKYIDSEVGRQNLCLNSELHLPERQADMFSIKPSEPTVAKIHMVWGKPEDNSDGCPENGASIAAVVTALITDEQKKIAETAEKWPVKQCQESLNGLKFTPISLPCYLASKDASTYREYTSDIKFSNMPEWFISTAQKFQSLVGLIQKQSSQSDPISKTSQVTNIKTLLKFSTNEPLLTVKLNSKEAVLDYSGFEFIENFLINTRFPMQDIWYINLGLRKVCLITPKFITTVDNRTIEVDEIKMRKKDTLVTADCSQNPRFAAFLDGSSNFQDLAFTLYAGADYLSVKPNNKEISIMLNGKIFDGETENSYINAWRLQDDVILARTKYGGLGIDIYYTKEYMVITIPGFYTGKICGICSSLKTSLP